MPRGHPWSEQLQLSVRKATASVTRGIGPARQSAPLDLASVWACDIPWRQDSPDLPLGGKFLVVACSFFCTREIEASLALRQHVSIDSSRNLVSWNLPCSKTDPSAVGKVRTWERVCGPVGNKPCAFHALKVHCEHLDDMFKERPVEDALPLFPTSSGATAKKEKVVRLIELVAISLGLPVVSVEGRRIYGGHSLRVSGAQWMARMNVPLPLIQLMARWASDVIARYVADVPLSNISAIYRRACCAKDLEDLVHESRESAAAARRELANMKDMFHTAFRDEIGSVSAPQAGAQAFPLCPPCVLKCKGGRMHVVANRAVSALPSFEWRSRCGWKFGLSDHSFSPVSGPLSGRCSVCFKDCVGGDSDSLSG